MKNLITENNNEIIISVNLKALKEALEDDAKKTFNNLEDLYQYYYTRILNGNADVISKALIKISRNMSKKGYSDYSYYGGTDK